MAILFSTMSRFISKWNEVNTSEKIYSHKLVIALFMLADQKRVCRYIHTHIHTKHIIVFRQRQERESSFLKPQISMEDILLKQNNSDTDILLRLLSMGHTCYTWCWYISLHTGILVKMPTWSVTIWVNSGVQWWCGYYSW